MLLSMNADLLSHSRHISFMNQVFTGNCFRVRRNQSVGVCPPCWGDVRSMVGVQLCFGGSEYNVRLQQLFMSSSLAFYLLLSSKYLRKVM